MTFNLSIDINQNIDKTVAIFSNPESLKHVQDGFISKELISGSEGEIGAKSKMVYEKLELIETIITNNLPEIFEALYEHKYTVNTMKVWFTPLSENETRYHTEIHYTKFNGLLINVMAKLFPSMFKKQVLKWMRKFKGFTEKQ